MNTNWKQNTKFIAMQGLFGPKISFSANKILNWYKNGVKWINMLQHDNFPFNVLFWALEFKLNTNFYILLNQNYYKVNRL